MLVSDLVLSAPRHAALDVRGNLARYESELADVSAARVQQAAANYLDFGQRGLVVAGPLSEFERTLRRRGEGVEFFVPQTTAHQLEERRRN